MRPTRLLLVSAFTCGLVAVTGSYAAAAAGDLDPSFGSGGIVLDDVRTGGPFSRVNDLAVDATSGRVFVVGTVDGLDPGGSTEAMPGIAAYSSSGTLLWKDTFEQRPCSDLGCPTLSGNNTFGNAAAIDPVDGTLVVAGFDEAVPSNTEPAPAGCVPLDCTSVYVMKVSLDGGLVTPILGDVVNSAWQRTITTDEACSPNFDETSLGITPTGDFLIGFGMCVDGSSGNHDFALVKFLASGDLDTSFGNNGLVLSDVGTGTDDLLQGLALQSDGKIVAAGTTRPCVGCFGEDYALVRYRPGGSIDASFGVNGRVTTDFDSLSDFGNGVAIQSDGKIVVAGSAARTDAFSRARFGFARYLPDGSLDSSFGNGGRVVMLNTCGPTACNQEEALDVAIDGQGRIVAAGDVEEDTGGLGPSRFAVDRLLPTGEADTAFGTDGQVITAMGSDFSIARGVAIQSDDRIVAAGSVASFDATTNLFGAARYLAGEALPAPDLVESAVGAAGSAHKVAVSDTVTNVGGATAGKSLTRYYLSTDTTRSGDDRLMQGKRKVPSLAPSATSSGTLSMKIPSVASGDYYILACADDTGLIVEGNETNNCAASSTTVFVP
jgi:uncharacterized delta-60 repeat protein